MPGASEQSVALFQHPARDRSAVATLIDHRTVTALWFEDFPMISVSIQRREIRWCKVWVARGVRRRGVASKSPRLRTLLGNEVPITGDASGEGRAIHDDCPSTVAASLLAAARGEVHGIRAVAMNDGSEDDGENGSDSSTETVITARRIVSHVLMSMSPWRAMFQLIRRWGSSASACG